MTTNGFCVGSCRTLGGGHTLFMLILVDVDGDDDGEPAELDRCWTVPSCSVVHCDDAPEVAATFATPEGRVVGWADANDDADDD